MNYCSSLYSFRRRKTREVIVGTGKNRLIIGGENPIVIQSMLTAKTSDTENCVKQIQELADAGCQLVRLTAPTIKDAENLRIISETVRANGYHVPLVADIHFTPEAAMEAALWVEKIGINPGNYADSKQSQTSYSEKEYQSALDKIEEKFLPLIERCKKLNRALRIGSNHGSLSNRIMNRYGDTPLGMVESALEYARIAHKHDFHNFVFSMKASSPKITIEAYRLLAAKLLEEGDDWNYPFHLGVTEAGLGTDGRIKSAVGIGALLADGIGDTIRVSLSEDSIHELPVCRDLLQIVSMVTEGRELEHLNPDWDPYSYSRRESTEITIENSKLGGLQPVRVFMTEKQFAGADKVELAKNNITCEVVYHPREIIQVKIGEKLPEIPPSALVTIEDNTDIPVISAFRWLASALRIVGQRNPILLKDTFNPQKDFSESPQLASSVLLGSLLCDGIGDAVLVRREENPTVATLLAWNILQASGTRSFRTEYISCPSCGRTLFDIQKVIAKIKSRTQHLQNIKIGIMGCIVNGPGEMADADFGYVGGAPGKVNLYVGKKPVKRGIPEDEAVDALVDLIKENGLWIDP